ncbi:MAG TPA: helix-turn-helix domain-containing protein [Longimicrobium sp.]|jgi:excisionase family DNA binding protein|uniref:helix-turn-helix domain-containing protein n=1 Tax=Longimicrobium sp. TaxID=2029185 RepID=UPI002EDA39B6
MMIAAKNVGAPVRPSADDVDLAKRSASALRRITRPDGAVTLILSRDQGSEQVTIPEIAFQMLEQILGEFAQGHAVALAPVDRQVTTQEGADILNVSRPHLVKLLEAGEIRFTRVGTHRRIRLADLLEYKARMDADADRAARELVELSQEMGLYD